MIGLIIKILKQNYYSEKREMALYQKILMKDGTKKGLLLHLLKLKKNINLEDILNYN